MDSHAGDLFSLPEFAQQDELLSLAPVARDVESTIDNPVAHIRLDMPQAHMDRPFDYEIPAKFADLNVGARVVVDVGSRKVDGFVVARDSSTQVAGALRPIRRVVSNLPVLSPEIERLAVDVARHQASSVADCLRLAIPQRHARAEKEFLELPSVRHREWAAPVLGEPLEGEPIGPWGHYDAGPAFLRHLSEGAPVNGVCQLLAGDHLPQMVAPAIRAVLSRGRGALILVPTPVVARHVANELADLLPGEPIATMVSEDDHASRYSQFLAVRSGRARVAVGTRTAAWAPVVNLGLVVISDDLHSAYIEPRSPYIHARELLVRRADLEGAAFLGVNFGPSIPLAALVASGWAAPILSNERALASSNPQVLDANHFAYEGTPWSRMPSSVFSVVRKGLEIGPVLMVVPRSGYIPLLSCERCRQLATCPTCGGRLQVPAPDQSPQCGLCGRKVPDFRCDNCGGTKLRSAKVGSHRSAQEIGRAFRSISIHLAGVGESASQLDSEPRIVVSTPGVEPEVEGGYAAAVVLDSGYLMRSTGLDSEAYFLRALAHTAARVKPRSEGGKLLVVGDVPPDLVRVAATWEFLPWARHQLSEREPIGQPPTKTWVEVSGPWDELRTFLSTLRGIAADAGLPLGDANAPLEVILTGGIHDLIPGMSVLGPSETRSGDTQIFLRFDKTDGESRLAVIRDTRSALSIDRTAPNVRVKVNPPM